MKRTLFFHFLLPKAREQEYERRGCVPYLHECELVETRDETPQLLQLFPWEIRKVLTENDLGDIAGIELSPEEGANHIINHWDKDSMLRMIQGERTRILIHDMDTNSDHSLLFIRWLHDQTFSIHGDWFKDFVIRRNLRAGMMIGMYWDIKSSTLRFSVLNSPEN